MMSKIIKENKKSYNEIINIRSEDAIYKEQIVAEFKGNPFIEALPTVDEILNRIKNIDYTPIITEEERNQKIVGRATSLLKIKNLTCRLSRFTQLSLAIDGILRHSYSFRNPLSPLEVEKIIKLATASKSSKDIAIFQDLFSEVAELDNMITVTGGSGIGKSKALKKILLNYPQLIRHSKYHGINMDTMTQVVWIKFDAPRDGSTRTLCVNFFNELDRILDSGTLYSDMYANITKSENEILNNIAIQCKNLGVGILIIDETQHLCLNKENSKFILNFFTEFANRIHIPVVFIGNNEVEKLFKVFRDVRRVGSGGEYKWLRMEKDDGDWRIVTNRLWGIQTLKNPGEYSEEINDALYDESQGIIAVLVNLFIFSQWFALIERKETLTSEIIHDTARIYMPRIKQRLDEYKKGVDKVVVFDIGTYENEIEDGQNNMEDAIAFKHNELETEENINDLVKKTNEEMTEDIVQMVLDTRINIPKDFNLEDLKKLIRKELESNKEASRDMILGIVILKISRLNTRKRKSEKIKKSTEGLMAIESNGNFSKALEEAGETPEYEEFGGK